MLRPARALSPNWNNKNITTMAEAINKIIIETGGKEYEFSGGGGGSITPGVPIPHDTVDSVSIVDGSVELEDLNDDVKKNMTHSYDAEGEGIRLGGLVE